MEEHYLSQQHQDTILQIVRQMRTQSADAQMDLDSSRTTTATTSDPATAQLQELYETLNILTGGIEALNDDGQRLSNESLQSQIKLQTLAEDFSQAKLSVEESHSFLEGVKHNQDILNQDLASLKEKINDMQYVSYDGTFVWKITNFKEKMSKLNNYLSCIIKFSMR
jgi:predicted  nucleic acid-binding Zn-ribbon protein